MKPPKIVHIRLRNSSFLISQGDRVVSSLSNVTLKSRETLVEAGDMLEGLCGEATVEAWLWKPPPEQAPGTFVSITRIPLPSYYKGTIFCWCPPSLEFCLSSFLFLVTILWMATIMLFLRNRQMFNEKLNMIIYSNLETR